MTETTSIDWLADVEVNKWSEKRVEEAATVSLLIFIFAV